MLEKKVCTLEQSKKLYTLGIRWPAQYGYADGHLRKRSYYCAFEAYGPAELHFLLSEYFNQSAYWISSFSSKTGHFDLYRDNTFIGSYNNEAAAQAERLILILMSKQTSNQSQKTLHL